jgi:dUTP pyrophosphatase
MFDQTNDLNETWYVISYIMSPLNRCDRYMILKIYSESQWTRHRYAELAKIHNDKLIQSNTFDAGFDLYVPDHVLCLRGEVVRIDFEIQCSAQIVTDNGKVYNTGFYMYPRSSLSKTRLRLANAVGIIDSGYRGNLIGAFDILEDCSVTKNSRLTQICAPSLMPVFVEVVEKFADLGEETERGSGGFGSTDQGTYGSPNPSLIPDILMREGFGEP